jgi:hypothetical protein
MLRDGTGVLFDLPMFFMSDLHSWPLNFDDQELVLVSSAFLELLPEH